MALFYALERGSGTFRISGRGSSTPSSGRGAFALHGAGTGSVERVDYGSGAGAVSLYGRGVGGDTSTPVLGGWGGGAVYLYGTGYGGDYIAPPQGLNTGWGVFGMLGVGDRERSSLFGSGSGTFHVLGSGTEGGNKGSGALGLYGMGVSLGGMARFWIHQGHGYMYGYADDELIAGEDVADVGVFSDDVDSIRAVHVADVGILSDEVSVLKTTRVDIADTGIFSDRVLLARIEFVIDGGVFADAISAPNQAVHLADGGVFADEVQGVRHPTVTIADVGIMADAVKTVRTATVADAGIMSDDIALMAAINVVDGGEFSDDIFVLRRPRTDVTDTGVLSDETQTYVIARVNIADVGWLSDSIRLSRPHVPPGQAPIVYEDAWTANTDTWGMSRYDNFGMTELAAINGRLYGVNADGVYAITADTDATVPIDAYVQTGLFSNYHRAQQRLTYLYADAQVAGRLSAIVYDVNAGMPGTFSYTFEPRRSGDVASQRAKLGRGLKSGRFSLKVTNVDGANFDIVGLLLLADNNSRRV